ncbi:hypothetical protein K470DRAFT_258892 [Piedraia hortae CBS 480.64]|uniref:Arrestin-like N-terminal domain-containing protein n=1 Tax=Piedraia hortae CBS 480.64 TaxID=1314780 RepID=A0A6A7BW14_9PEZI|nr:hypothetical protein K470DRAFT_258892 [Piedraia hortae CBS 480.64]
MTQPSFLSLSLLLSLSPIPMALNTYILLDRGNQSSYNSHTPLEGKVVVNLPTKTALKSVFVSLFGVTFNPKAIKRDRHVFLSEHDEVLPKEREHEPLQPGRHEFPFQFTFPVHTKCSCGGRRSKVPQRLPPSLFISNSCIKNSYFVQATVTTRHKKRYDSSAGFLFYPANAPHTPSLMDDSKHYTFKSIPQTPEELTLTSPPHSTSDPFWQPNITVTGHLPSSVLTVGKPIPLSITIRKNSIWPAKQDIYLTSLHVRLVSNLTTTSRFSPWAMHSDSVAWYHSARGAANLLEKGIVVARGGSSVGEVITLDPAHWSYYSVSSSCGASFKTCSVEKWHWLDVKMGVAMGEGTKKQETFIPMVFFITVNTPVKGDLKGERWTTTTTTSLFSDDEKATTTTVTEKKWESVADEERVDEKMQDEDPPSYKDAVDEK